MMHLLFIDDYACSSQNGIGTFRDIFLQEITEYHCVDVSLISMNTDVLKVESCSNKRFNQIKLPRFGHGKWRQCGSDIASALCIEISDSKENIFVMNYSPCSEFITELKRIFPLSRWVFIIHDQGWCAPLLGDANLLTDILNGEKPDIVSTKTFEYVRSYSLQEQSIYDCVDKIICLSDSAYNVMLHGYKVSHQKLSIIQNGINVVSRKDSHISKLRARAELGIEETDTVIISVGRPVRHKGIIALLLAMQNLVNNRPKIKCVLAGNANIIIRRISAFNDIMPNIILPGYLTHKELSLWYSAANVGVIPSYTEQCSYAALEMMSTGLPLAVSDGFGLRDMFIDDVNAFVAHIGNVLDVNNYAKRLSVTIERALAASDVTINRHAKYNQKMLNNRYSASSMAQSYVNVFKEITL